MMLELIDKVSLAFGHVTRLLFLGMIFIFTAVVAASSFVLLVSAPFEYSYGQDDLAMADLIVLALLALASWRYFRRGRQSQTRLWPLLKRFALTLTFVTLLLLSAMGVFASVALGEAEMASEQISGGGEDLVLYGVFCVFILAIYGATPLPALSTQREAKPKAASGQQDEQKASDYLEPEPPTLNTSDEGKL